ncbi:MAG TPA: Xaa-Pro peptidase family protein [Candidatus Binatia bacterium]|nr:Xaa-Pro peptidase family protein [Candidatus Binatia bacterium]
MRDTKITQRLADVRDKLGQIGAEGLLVTGSANRRWLSGFQGSYGWLLVTADSAFLGTDFRYWEQAQRQAPHFELVRLNKDRTQIDVIRDAHVRQMAIEAQHLSLSDYRALQEVPNVITVESEGLVEGLRAVKDRDELSHIRAAARITDAAMDHVREVARLGMTESALAWELEKVMREAGASGLAFPVHVASGPNAARPHHAPGHRALQSGDALIVDLGATYEGYASDLTRTFYIGSEVSERFGELFRLVLKAHDAAIASIRPHMAGREVDAVARDVIASAGHGEDFGHGLGHGLGLEAHEAPRLSPTRADLALLPGMVTTIEPGVYLPGWGGIRIEDLVLVTEQGAELISHSPFKPLLQLA